MLRKPFPSDSLLAQHLASFRRQESIFIGLNLLILGVFVFYPCVFRVLLGKADSAADGAIGHWRRLEN